MISVIVLVSLYVNYASLFFCFRSVFRHYRVTQKQQGGYIIDVENPVCENDFLNKENLCESNNLRKISLLILFFRLFLQIPCPTLHDVINALVEKTAGTLQPFILEEPYEENISTSQTRSHMYCIRSQSVLLHC